VQKQINTDTGLGTKTLAVIDKFAWREKAEQARAQLINLWTVRGKQLLPHAAKRALDPLTDAVVSANAGKREKEAAAASRTDVRGGAATFAAGRQPFTVKDMKGKGAGKALTDEEILNL
jgi:DNA polymerase IIIc chi subunit